MLFLLAYCSVKVRTIPNTFVRTHELGTYADAHGIAILKVKDGDTLLLKHVGFRDTSIVVSCSRREIEVVMEPSLIMFPDVVVEKTIGENVSTRPVRAVSRESIIYPSVPFLRPDDLLEEVQGVFFVGKDPTASVPAVRGLAYFRTLVILDFFRLSTEREIGPSLFFAPSGVVREVEVAEGGGVPFGSDAMGGTVIYLLKGVGSPPEFSLSLRSNPLSYSLYASTTPFDSAYVGVASSSMFGYRYPDTTLSNGFWGRGALEAPASNRKFATVVEWRRWGVSLKGAFFGVRDFYRAYKGTAHYPRIDHLFLMLGSRYLSGGYHGYTTVMRKGPTENIRTGRDATLRFQYDRGELHVGVAYFGRFGVRSSILEEGVWMYDEISDGYTHDLGIFVFGERSLRNLMLSFGGRLGLYRATNVSGWKPANAFNLGFRLSAGDWSLFGNLETSYRFPTLSESMSYSPHPRGFLLGNPDLEPERGLGGDVGCAWERGGLRGEALLFATSIDNYIDLVVEDTLTPEGDTIFRYHNVPGNVIVRGLELRGRWNAGSFGLEGGYAWIGSAGATVISGIPPSHLFGRLEWRGPVKAYLKILYQPTVEEVSPIEIPRSSSMTLTLGVRGRFRGVDIDAGVSNLTNSLAYRTLNPKSLPLPGRGFFLNLHVPVM
ncbi:MAG: TonB-dependent receptor [Thermotogae bacterium]|nr:TonB-dependent receptor [Thermotogota bacterium]